MGLHQVADRFRIKLAAAMRERPMGDPKNPNLENVVLNIRDLVRGFNYLASQEGGTEQLNQVLQQLQNLGIQFTP